MIELTEEQRRALDGTEQPPVVLDPETGEEASARTPGDVRENAAVPQTLGARVG